MFDGLGLENRIEDRGALMAHFQIPEDIMALVEGTDRLPFLPFQTGRHPEMVQPIGCDQTMSAMWIVAWQVALAKIGPQDKVLEIGGGSGYLAAVLAKRAKEVHIVECHEELARLAARNKPGENVTVWWGNGFLGVPEKAPFTKVVVSCMIPDPTTLSGIVRQLADPARIIVPVRHPQYDCCFMGVIGREGREISIDFAEDPLSFVPALDCLSPTPPVQIL